MMKYFLIVLVGLLFIGCSRDFKVEVKADTYWNGTFGHRSVDGNGSKIIDISDDKYECAYIHKPGEGGTLKARVFSEGGNFLSPNYEGEWVTTTAYNGVVHVCNDVKNN